jgi:hypothetical protein
VRVWLVRCDAADERRGATGAATCVQCSAGTYSGGAGVSGPLLHQY